ncbi:MAG TPA: hypothetical protein VFP65_05900, partial [Anaeromyxobacteraceae bacterium]|nr:hypothetical protein [Anaeromyxobacteraceae bacterium]
AASKRTKARKLWRGTLADHAEALTLLAQACDLGDDYACDALKKIPANCYRAPRMTARGRVSREQRDGSGHAAPMMATA